MTRTFSKIHGLAALRIGWAYCPAQIADVLNRIRGPFNLGSAAIAAGAAAMADAGHVEAAATHNEKWLGWLAQELKSLGIETTPSVANFVLMHFPAAPDPRNAIAADEFLKSKAIILRRVASYGLPDALRVTIGTEEENRAVIAALSEFMGAARK